MAKIMVEDDFYDRNISALKPIISRHSGSRQRNCQTVRQTNIQKNGTVSSDQGMSHSSSQRYPKRGFEPHLCFDHQKKICSNKLGESSEEDIASSETSSMLSMEEQRGEHQPKHKENLNHRVV